MAEIRRVRLAPVTGVNQAIANNPEVDNGSSDSTLMTPAKTERSINKRRANMRVASIAALRLFSNPSVTRVYLESYYGNGRGGDGDLEVNASDTTSADNGGTIIVDALGRRWYRVNRLRVTALQFGAVPDEHSGTTYDNKPHLDAAFAWALAQNTGVTVDLESFTYACSSAPLIGVPSTAAAPNQANGITVRGSRAWRMAGRPGARIRVMATQLGQHQAILRIDGTQSMSFLTLKDFTLECPIITANVAAQNPVGNAIVITGGDAAGFVTGTPVSFTGGGGASEISRTSTAFYYLIKQPEANTFRLAISPENAAAGTAITLTTAWTGTTVANATTGTAVNGLLFDGTRWTAPKVEGIRTLNADNGFVIRVAGDTVNGEFVAFTRCEAVRCRRFFLMPEGGSIGQSLEHKFFYCSANPRMADGEACFEYGDGNRGFGVTAIGFDASVVPVPTWTEQYRKKILFIRDNGSSDSNVFIGGRVENITSLIEMTRASWEERTFIDSMTFAAICPTDANPLVQSTQSAQPTVAGSVKVANTHFYSPNTTWARDNLRLNFKGGTVFGVSVLFERCTFDINKRALLQAGGGGSIEFKDCTQRYRNAAGSTVNFKRWSEKIFAQVPHAISDKAGAPTIGCYPGAPGNLLVWPNFGNTTGASVVAPAPWVHTGSAAAFNRCDLPTDVVTPSARTVRFEPLSGVKQVLNIVPTSGVPLYYHAHAFCWFMNNPQSDRLRIALENEQTGEVYDEIFLGAQPNLRTGSPVTLVANPTATGTGQSYRLVIDNLSATGVTQLRINWQMVTTVAHAAYALPRTDGQAEADHTTVWDANIDTLRAVGRMAVPYKTDSYGKSSNLRDVFSDFYLSQTTERLTYAAGSSQAAGQKWWDVPRVVYLAARPTTGSWVTGDYVQNTAPAVAGSAGSQYVVKGWIRLTTGANNALGTDWVEDRALTGT